jgi:YVTN family beta-propeller protein
MGAAAWFFEPDGVRATGPEACHVWTRRGEFRVFLTVSAGTRRADALLRVLVMTPPADPPPGGAASMVYDAVRHRVWVVHPDGATVGVVDARGARRLDEVVVGEGPRTLAVAGDAVLVACQGDGTLHFIDAVTRVGLGFVAFGAGSRPHGVAADPRGRHAFVTLQGAGELAVVDVAARAVVARVDVGRDPRGVAANGAGAVLVTRWRATAVGAVVVQIDARLPLAPAVVGEIALPADDVAGSELDAPGVPGFLDQVVFAPDGQRALVPCVKANVVDGRARSGVDLRPDSTVRAALRELLVPAPDVLGLVVTSFSFDDADRASAAAYAPRGDRVWVALQGAEAVAVLETFRFNTTGSVDTFLAASPGAAPQGLVLDPAGERLYVQGLLARSVRVYDVRDLSRPPPLVAEIPTQAVEPLDAAVLRGKRVFYASRDPRMSLTSYVSCASCHLDGDGDGLTWDFTQRGEGLRNTIPLAGRGGADLGPLHWSANFDEVQDFEHDIRGGQGGTGFLDDARFHAGTRDHPLGDPKAGLSPALDDLTAYVASLTAVGTSPHRRDDDAQWRAAVARGEAVFRRADVGCAACHDGPYYSDSRFGPDRAPVLHDVGTLTEASGARLGGPLTGLDTPSLRGLWSSAPYLHDGSAPALRDVLVTRNQAGRHGHTSHLTTDEMRDLEQFLLSRDDAPADRR